MELLNKYALIRMTQDKTQLSNGLAITETRGKRDIVSGIVLNADSATDLPIDATVWFPLYAATTLSVSGEQLLLVHYDDIVMIQRKEE